jgi:hypothetical protein
MRSDKPQKPEFNGTADAGVVRFWAKEIFVFDRFRRKSPCLDLDLDWNDPGDGSFAAMHVGVAREDCSCALGITNENNFRGFEKRD